MKKIISVLLVAMMLFSVVAISASAALCDCGNHVPAKGENCHCCLDCPDLKPELILNCARQNGVYTSCCPECSGIFDGINYCDCDCGCPVCERLNSSKPSDDDALIDGIVTDADKQSFVEGFQAILKRISDLFDSFFDSIFEFLRLDEVLGRN